MSNVSFEGGLKVVSQARKLIVKVPQGPVVSFPEGALISPYGQNNDSAVIVVHNRVDKSMGEGGTWQGADSVNGVVILNGVPEAVALEVLALYEANPTIEGLNALLVRAAELGCVDQYTTKTSFVDSKLSPAGKMLDQYTGIVKRDDRDICLVVRDSAGTIWRKLGEDVKHIDTEAILVRDYVNADGSQIDPAKIPTSAS